MWGVTQVTQIMACECRKPSQPQKVEIPKENPCFEICSSSERLCCPRSVPSTRAIFDESGIISFTCPRGVDLKNILKNEKNLRYGEQYFFKKDGLKLSYLYNPVMGGDLSKIPFVWGNDFNVSIKLDKIRFITVPKTNTFYEISCNYDCENEKGQKTTIIVSSEFTRENIKVFGKPLQLNGAQDAPDAEGHWFTSQTKNPEDIVFKLSRE